MSDSLERQLERSINQSGLLFQEHPEIEGWSATRAGLAAEIAAFSGKDFDPPFDRLSVKFYDAGEEDENGIEYAERAWVLVAYDRGEYEPRDRVFTDREEMVERLAAIMSDVSESREVASDE